MTTSTSQLASPTDAHHRHDRTCYWDHLRCGWVCLPATTPPAADPVPARETAVEAPAALES